MGKFYHNKFTISDTAGTLTQNPLVFTDVDFQIQTQAVDIGDQNAQNIELNSGDTLSYRDAVGVDIRPMFFKNHTATQTGYVVVMGVLKD